MKRRIRTDEASRPQGASGPVNVLVTPQGESAAQPHEAPGSEKSTNPLYLLAAIALGLPGLAMILVVGGNPGIQEGTLATLTTLLVLSAFVVAVIFEIKRLADQPSDKNLP